MQMLAILLVVCSLVLQPQLSGSETTSIYKVDYPDTGYCGQETNVTKSDLNPHWFFPMKFGGFHEGNCSDVGYTSFEKRKVVEMHPVPWVHHNLTFDIYAATQTQTTALEFVDGSRGKRVVKIEWCAPNKPGTWPLYIFGHGAGCLAQDYQYFCQVAAVAMVYQDSPAGSVFPADFDSSAAAADAAFLANKLPELARDTYPFYGKLDGTVVMGGHSMGGGMTVLSVGRDDANVQGISLFAPGLYTKPDAKPFLSNITVPTLIVSGSMDCGQNALDKQAQPTFDGLNSSLKVLVVLKGANHCQWIQPFETGLGVCSTFEKNECHSISRAQQHELGARLFKGFATALHSEDGWSEFEQMLDAGEVAGTWAYLSSKSSAPGKVLHNDCPCTDQRLAQETLFL